MMGGGDGNKHGSSSSSSGGDGDGNNNTRNTLSCPSSSSIATYYSPNSSNWFIPIAIGHSIVSHMLWPLVGSSISSTSSSTINRNRQAASILSSSSSLSSSPPPIVVITGANTGIGYETARTLALQGCEVVLACRTKSKALQAKQRIEQDLQQQHDEQHEQQLIRPSPSSNGRGSSGSVVVLDQVLDLTDFGSITKYVQELETKYSNVGGVDVLINNAGRNTSGTSTTRTSMSIIQQQQRSSSSSHIDNIDIDLMFQANYLGHFLLTKLLLDGTTTNDDGDGGGHGGNNNDPTTTTRIGLLRRRKSDNNTNDRDSTKSSKAVESATVINVSSVMHQFAAAASASATVSGSSSNMADDNDDDDDMANVKYWLSYVTSSTPSKPGVYSCSKLAAIYHAIEINRLYSNVSPDDDDDDQVRPVYAVVVNPGSVASDIWRGFPSWIRSIFKRVYLTPQQGSVPLVAAAMEALEEQSPSTTTSKQQQQKPAPPSSSSTIPTKIGAVRYLQPYWVPPYYQRHQIPVPPFMEMLGPYVGYTSSTPRLVLQQQQYNQQQGSSDTDNNNNNDHGTHGNVNHRISETLWNLSAGLCQSARAIIIDDDDDDDNNNKDGEETYNTLTPLEKKKQQ